MEGLQSTRLEQQPLKDIVADDGGISDLCPNLVQRSLWILACFGFIAGVDGKPVNEEEPVCIESVAEP